MQEQKYPYHYNTSVTASRCCENGNELILHNYYTDYRSRPTVSVVHSVGVGVRI